MTPDPVFSAFGVPPESVLRLRIAKRLLSERAATAAGDATLLDSLVDRAEWYAALRPGPLGLQAFSDDTRDYPEIAIVLLTLKSRPNKTDTRRLQTLLHAAVPKPLALVMTVPAEGVAGVSLALKTRHPRERDRRVAAPPTDTGWFSAASPDAPAATFLAGLTPIPTDLHLLALYERWCRALTDLAVARRLGDADTPAPAASPGHASTGTDDRPARLAELAKLDRELTSLRAAMAKAKTPGQRSALMPKIQKLLAHKTSLEEKLR